MHSQSHSAYPIARSGSDEDVISAAESRAKFWNYPQNGPWSVYVAVGKRTITVQKSSNGEVSIVR